MNEYEAALAQHWIDAEAARQEGKPIPAKPEVPLKLGECREKIGHLYESQIRGLIPFAIRGVLWDQGEGGTGIQGIDQFTLTGALIRCWRNDWGQGNFPFLYVQKPSGGGCAWDPANPINSQASKFAALPLQPPSSINAFYTEMHNRIRNFPNTGMVQSSDLGSGTHPANKSGYGPRACRLALGMVYGKDVEYYGPVYRSHKFDREKAIVAFTHTGQGLAFKHGDRLQGFAIAGADRKFHWADAVIDGDAVIVSSRMVNNPVAVRYAWGGSEMSSFNLNDDIAWANLFNKDGLPALMFRTDDWDDGFGESPLSWILYR